MRNVKKPMIGLVIPCVALAGLAIAFAQDLPEPPAEQAPTIDGATGTAPASVGACSAGGSGRS